MSEPWKLTSLLPTGRKLLELMDHREAVRDLAFAPDGSLRLATASLDHTLKVNSYETFFLSLDWDLGRNRIRSILVFSSTGFACMTRGSLSYLDDVTLIQWHAFVYTVNNSGSLVYLRRTWQGYFDRIENIVTVFQFQDKTSLWITIFLLSIISGLGLARWWKYVQNPQGSHQRSLLVLLVSQRAFVGLCGSWQKRPHLGHGQLRTVANSPWSSAQRRMLWVFTWRSCFGHGLVGHARHFVGPVHRFALTYACS